MSVGKPRPPRGTSAPALAREVAILRGRVADLGTECAEARVREASIRLAMTSLGHELNGPLSVLVSRIDLMREEANEHGLPRTVVEDLAVIQRHVERLGRLVGVMLTHAEPGQTERALIDLNGVVRETVALAAKPLDERGVRVHLTLDERLPDVPGDPVALGQVVMNLLLDTRKAVPAGGAVWVKTARTDDRSPGVCLLLGDARPRTADAIRESLGGPFHTTESNGNGFGLWMTRAIVRDHGGTIDFRFRAGKGSTWIIRLPGGNERSADA
jgi:two-component system, NtrC family, sensor kinase